MITCPCCGGRGEIEEKAPVPLSPLEFAIYDTVRRCPDGINVHELADRVYAGRRDGGPEYAGSSIRVTIMRVNRKLKGKGLRIAGTYHRTGERLQTAEAGVNRAEHLAEGVTLYLGDAAVRDFADVGQCRCRGDKPAILAAARLRKNDRQLARISFRRTLRDPDNSIRSDPRQSRPCSSRRRDFYILGAVSC